MSGDIDAVAKAKKRTQEVLRERNMLVALLAMLAKQMGWTVGIRKTNIPDWKPDWEWCCYIDLPTGQISFHFPDDQLPLFAGLEEYTSPYDDHGKPQVAARIAELIKMLTG